MERVKDKVGVITGAGAGLGKADALRLSEEGAKLVLTDINEVEGRRTGEECEGEAIFFAQDVKDESSWPRLIETTIAAFGRLDVLVNNAGNSHIANIESASTDQWHDILRVHLDGTFFGCRSAIPEMTKSGGGSIINMSSVAALVGLSPYLAYSAAKGGIRSMTKSIAIYCREQKNLIRCNSIHPGSVETPMGQHAMRGVAATLEEGRERYRKGIPLKEIGEPDDIAYAVLYLASDEAKYVTGQELTVDGGIMMS